MVGPFPLPTHLLKQWSFHLSKSRGAYRDGSVVLAFKHLKGLCSVSKLSYLRISYVHRGRFPNLPTFHKRTVTLSPRSDLPDEKRLGATKTKLFC